jgi:hypothetical protein
MTAITGSFGMPETQQATRATRSTFPQVLVLMVTRGVGGFARELPIASAMTPEELDVYLGEWLKIASNRDGYASSRIVSTNFVTPTK